MILKVLISLLISILFVFLIDNDRYLRKSSGNIIKQIMEYLNEYVEEDDGQCPKYSYRIRIVNKKPLIIYIENMLKENEIEHLIQLAKASFKPSMVSIGKEGSAFVSDYRTSSSAQIDRYETHLVQCLLRRFAHFQGIDDVQRIEPFQVVEYVDQQQSGYHYDWFERVDPTENGGQRVSTFFTYLRSNCSTGGETEFVDVPFNRSLHNAFCDILVCDPKSSKSGIRFRPLSGNSLFWFNLDEHGEGDRLTYHAGLPPGHNSFKIGLNTWTRAKKFYWPGDE